ncbi:hypothetical protein PHISCL_08098 [Aspergillus sclerotialis]|uniref:Uncharacterized protein n=1 Tax=Aspergillus sclerotialis TaxID=2070753 RepID=A0A3A2ZJM5_9EURO|nr:hypothetical protein PHISCL_08098 [Aspergillus sclerotialis]
MRNQPNDQRSIQNTISKSLQIKVELIGVIHGTMRPDSDPATLMVLQTRCIFPKIPVRVTGSEIQITFDAASSSDPAPTVAGLSPDPPYVFGLDASGIDTPDGNEQQEGKITATSRVSEPAFHRRNTAIWTIEGSSTGNGVPSTMQVAVLLRRESCREFRARFKIRFKVGSLRETMTLAKSAAESPGTTVLFDPRKPSFGSLDVDPKNLASYDLNQWLRFELPVLKPPAVQKGYYVELWNFQVSGSVILPTPSPGLSKEVPGFQDLPCIRWSRELDDLLFEDFFPWATKEPRRERDTTVHADGPPNFQGEERRICSVL